MNFKMIHLALLAGGVGLTVLSYNVWAFRCGHCTLTTFCTLGPYSCILLALTGVAAGVLLWLKGKARRRLAKQRCACGVHLSERWVFCPVCGKDRL